jgi:hypothetical protein
MLLRVILLRNGEEHVIANPGFVGLCHPSPVRSFADLLKELATRFNITSQPVLFRSGEASSVVGAESFNPQLQQHEVVLRLAG